MEKVLFTMTNAYLKARMKYFLNKSKESIHNGEFRKYAYYSEKYSIVRDLFWVRYERDYERAIRLCTREN